MRSEDKRARRAVRRATDLRAHSGSCHAQRTPSLRRDLLGATHHLHLINRVGSLNRQLILGSCGCQEQLRLLLLADTPLHNRLFRTCACRGARAAQQPNRTFSAARARATSPSPMANSSCWQEGREAAGRGKRPSAHEAQAGIAALHRRQLLRTCTSNTSCVTSTLTVCIARKRKGQGGWRAWTLRRSQQPAAPLRSQMWVLQGVFLTSSSHCFSSSGSRTSHRLTLLEPEEGTSCRVAGPSGNVQELCSGKDRMRRRCQGQFPGPDSTRVM